jgi:hypothetical protein
MAKYRCIRNCVWNSQYYKVGQIYEIHAKKEDVPHHFETITSPKQEMAKLKKKQAPKKVIQDEQDLVELHNKSTGRE